MILRSDRDAPGSEGDDQLDAIKLFSTDEAGFVEDPPEEEDTVPEEYKSKTKAQILQELEALKQQADLTQSIATSLQGLGQPRQEGPKPEQPAQPQAAPELDLTNENFFDDTMGNLDKFFRAKNAPLMRELAERDLRKDGRLMQLDPVNGEFARKHWDEIQGYVKALPDADRFAGNAYDRALAAVQSAHPAEMQQQALSDQLKSNPQAIIEALTAAGYEVKQSNGHQQVNTGTSYVPGDGAPPPPKGAKRRRYRPSVEDDRIARNRGIALDDYIATKTGIPKEQLEIVTR